LPEYPYRVIEPTVVEPKNPSLSKEQNGINPAEISGNNIKIHKNSKKQKN